MMDGERCVIGIAGGSCSGKTYICQSIIGELSAKNADYGRRIATVSLSDFYRELPPEDARRAEEGRYNFDLPDDFDWPLLQLTLRRFLQGESVCIRSRRGGSGASNSDSNEISLDGVKCVLLEGILALHDPGVRETMALKIFVEEDSDTRLCRRVQRDVEEQGKSIDVVLKQYLDFVKPAFDNYVSPSKRFSDIIVPHALTNTVAQKMIIRRVEKLLKSGVQQYGT